MLFMPDAQILDATVSAIVFEDTVDRRAWSPAGFFIGGSIPLSEVRVGETCYRLRQPLYGEFLPGDDTSCEFWAGRFSPRFIGKGAHAHDAYRDWRNQVHEVFQELFGKRPFEMTADDRECWELLEDLIDVVGYRNETPVVIRQIGTISQSRPLPRRVAWLDGHSEMVDLDVMPGEFAGYKPGQPFEADVECDPLTGKLLRVRSVRRISPVQPMADSELNKFWDAMSGTSTLPASKRNWVDT